MIATVQPLGDSAAVIHWPEASDDLAAVQVKSLANDLRNHWQQGYEAIVPAFASMTLHYSPLLLSWDEVNDQLRSALHRGHQASAVEARHMEIPVCYAAEFAPDLHDVASTNGLTEGEVIALHSDAQYSVRMIGFSPGFPYLAGLPFALSTPRRATPRLTVPACSVAIGGRQSGIYSLETPGGWHIIGRTPLAMFRPDLNPPCWLRAGDRVSFVPISVDQFQSWPESP